MLFFGCFTSFSSLSLSLSLIHTPFFYSSSSPHPLSLSLSLSLFLKVKLQNRDAVPHTGIWVNGEERNTGREIAQVDASFCFRELEWFIVMLIRPESLHVFVNAPFYPPLLENPLLLVSDIFRRRHQREIVR